MTKLAKLQKKDILHLVLAIVGTVGYALCDVWAYNFFKLPVSIALFASIPVLLTLFMIGIFLKKQGLYKIALLVVYFGAIIIVCACLVMQSGILEEFLAAGDGKELGNILQRRFGNYVYLAIIIVEFLQVTFVPIPSSIVTGAAYYICGQNPWLAILFSCIGLWLGSLFAFFLGRTFGIKLVKWVAGEKLLLKYNDLIKGKDKIMLIYMFILPVFPDDILCLIAGLTTMTYAGFTLIQLVSRPLNVGATIMLLHFGTELTSLIPINKVWGICVWVVIAAAFVALFIFVWKKADKIEEWMYKLISKITGRPILVDINKLYGIKTKPVEEPVKQEEAPAQTIESIATAEGDEQVVEDPLEIERKLMEEEAMREKKEAEKTKQAYDSACSILNSDDSEIKF